jgi:hypothetical protein
MPPVRKLGAAYGCEVWEWEGSLPARLNSIPLTSMGDWRAFLEEAVRGHVPASKPLDAANVASYSLFHAERPGVSRPRRYAVAVLAGTVRETGENEFGEISP